MMKKGFFFLFVSTILLLACNNNGNDNKVGHMDTTAARSPITKRVVDLEPAMANTDSLQVLFYDDPAGDSLRYSRFFTYTETADTAQVKSLLQELNQVYVQETGARPCRSEGKLYLLRGEYIVKTIYFSARPDSCRYFYFIKDGAFIYLPLTDTAAAWLATHRKKATKPKPK
ncbi:hypothetical protein HRG84_02995 [Flavisolibacter sp. BT320]|nr:hypothetical protein [Flavisolibacter longurius]